jgi:transketolase
MISIRESFGKTLLDLGESDNNIVLVSCDLKVATKSDYFFQRFPERSFEVGIAEANAIGVAAGLSMSGYKAVLSSFGAFLTGKNVEIRTSIAYNNAPVVLVGTHGGLIGPDGATQSGIQDISVMRSMPRMKVFSPLPQY